MAKILVYTESSNGKLKRSSCELLSAAKKSGATVIALALGSKASELAAEVGKYGASDLLTIKDPLFDIYNSELFTAAIFDVIKKTNASIVLASTSSTGKDLFPRVAARLRVDLVSDATELTIVGEDVSVNKPFYSGKALAKISFTDSPIKIVLMRANQLPLIESNVTPTVSEHSFQKPDLKTFVKDVVRGTSEKLDLTEANIIVSGGRGLKEASNFKMIEDLASVLGATVGASRAVVDAGWVSHSMQVGQTGKTVAPSLYIAIGISGAIQHLAGMSSSKVIVAINSDPNAPIFQKATYGIVGDAFAVVPLLIEEFKKVLQH